MADRQWGHRSFPRSTLGRGIALLCWEYKPPLGSELLFLSSFRELSSAIDSTAEPWLTNTSDSYGSIRAMR